MSNSHTRTRSTAGRLMGVIRTSINLVDTFGSVRVRRFGKCGYWVVGWLEFCLVWFGMVGMWWERVRAAIQRMADVFCLRRFPVWELGGLRFSTDWCRCGELDVFLYSYEVRRTQVCSSREGFFSFFFFLFLFVCRELQTFGAREQRENTCQAVVLGPL